MAELRFHVVQIARSDPPAVEIIRSCAELEEAERVAKFNQQEDLTGHFDYFVTDEIDYLVSDGPDKARS
ncbi:MAG: hypothetical protein ABJA02_03780 [Acidobacteriota bacterium]